MGELPTANIVPGGKRGVDWQKSTSPRGFVLAEVISAVYKEMRRGKEEEAVAWALEMCLSGEEATDFFWETMGVFALEDIGLAHPDALEAAQAAEQLYYRLPRGDSRRLLAITHIVCHFTRLKKTRYCNELLADVQHRLASGEMTLVMPDYAVDKHTARGRAMGRRLLHYHLEAAHLENEDPRFPRIYRERSIVRAREVETPK